MGNKIETPPPTFRIKLLHERKSGPHRKIDGMCGKRYIFTFDEKLKHYAFTPKTEAEASDIFATVGRTTMSAFAPVSIELTEKPKAAADADSPEGATMVAPDVTAIEECILRGIVITEDDSAEVVERLLKVARKADHDGEQRGVSKADEEVAALKKQIEDANAASVIDTRSPQQKAADTRAAKKAAQATTQEPPKTS